MTDIATLPPLEIRGHTPSVGANADHPMRIMTRRAAGLQGGAWDKGAAETVRGVFDSLADEWHTRESPERLAVVNDALERGADPLIDPSAARSGVAAEIGSGLGTYSGAISARFGSTLAVELSEEMQRLAHPSAATRILADGSMLPVIDGSLLGVVLINCFLFPQEIDRVLAPGGVLLWVNSSGERTPIHLSTDDVLEALPFETTGTQSRAGVGTWCALKRLA